MIKIYMEENDQWPIDLLKLIASMIYTQNKKYMTGQQTH